MARLEGVLRPPEDRSFVEKHPILLLLGTLALSEIPAFMKEGGPKIPEYLSNGIESAWHMHQAMEKFGLEENPANPDTFVNSDHAGVYSVSPDGNVFFYSEDAKIPSQKIALEGDIEKDWQAATNEERMAFMVDYYNLQPGITAEDLTTYYRAGFNGEYLAQANSLDYLAGTDDKIPSQRKLAGEDLETPWTAMTPEEVAADKAIYSQHFAAEKAAQAEKPKFYNMSIEEQNEMRDYFRQIENDFNLVYQTGSLYYDKSGQKRGYYYEDINTGDLIYFSSDESQFPNQVLPKGADKETGWRTAEAVDIAKARNDLEYITTSRRGLVNITFDARKLGTEKTYDKYEHKYINHDGSWEFMIASEAGMYRFYFHKDGSPNLDNIRFYRYGAYNGREVPADEVTELIKRFDLSQIASDAVDNIFAIQKEQKEKAAEVPPTTP